LVSEVLLFLFGGLGALLTVYLATQEVIPEFRALFDIGSKVVEVDKLRSRVRTTQDDIDSVQEDIKKPDIPSERADRLERYVKDSLKEKAQDLDELRGLERDVKQGQITSRSLGFFTYVILGGAFAVLLAGRIQLAGFTGDLSDVLESFVIGATWTSYLSTVGFRGAQKGVEERLQRGLSDANEKFEELKKEVSKTVAEKVAEAEKAPAVENPQRADRVASEITDMIDSYQKGVQKSLDLTRQASIKEARRLL